jgi:excisionase family DNA binding protein
MNHNKQTPKTFCTTQEAAKLLSVSLRTAQLWVESGLLEAWKTDGGHRRISRQSIESLLAKTSGNSALQAVVESQSEKRLEQKKQSDELTVLVVEDEPALRRLYEIKLRGWQLPIKVISADDGYEALILIGKNKPDLLITDLHMPGMDGFRMINTICSMSELSDVEIVVVSGLDAAEIARRGDIPKGIPILPKPIPFDRLRTIAGDLLLKRNETFIQEPS